MLKFLLIFLLIFFIIRLIGKYIIHKIFTPPSMEDTIKEQKANEGKVTIQMPETPADKPEPKINDYGKDVDFEEVKDDK